MLPAIEIKEKAKEIGFDACGIAQVAAADSEALFFDRWRDKIFPHERND